MGPLYQSRIINRAEVGYLLQECLGRPLDLGELLQGERVLLGSSRLCISAVCASAVVPFCIVPNG
jgi:hypothetical protein